ncbi:MAG: hypothetical protein ACRKGH_03145 [Dehalogenimonas sp.]
MEKKLKQVGAQFRVLGIVVFLIGVFLGQFEVSGGVVIIAIGLMSAIQGSILEYVFRE